MDTKTYTSRDLIIDFAPDCMVSKLKKSKRVETSYINKAIEVLDINNFIVEKQKTNTYLITGNFEDFDKETMLIKASIFSKSQAESDSVVVKKYILDRIIDLDIKNFNISYRMEFLDFFSVFNLNKIDDTLQDEDSKCISVKNRLITRIRDIIFMNILAIVRYMDKNITLKEKHIFTSTDISFNLKDTVVRSKIKDVVTDDRISISDFIFNIADIIIKKEISKKGNKLCEKHFNIIKLLIEDILYNKNTHSYDNDNDDILFIAEWFDSLKSKIANGNRNTSIKDKDKTREFDNVLYKIFLDGELYYIGKTKQVGVRINQHLNAPDGCLYGVDRNRQMEIQISVDELSDVDLELYETYYIHKYKPPMNKSKIGYVGESKLNFQELEFKTIYSNWKNWKAVEDIDVRDKTLKQIQSKQIQLKHYKIKESLLISLYKTTGRQFTSKALVLSFGNLKHIKKMKETNRLRAEYVKNAIENLELNNLICEKRKTNEYFVKVKDKSKKEEFLKEAANVEERLQTL